MTNTATRIGNVVITVTDNVVHALIDRPEVKNAIDESVVDGLEAAVEVAERRRTRALVIRGSGRTFCAGADLRELERMRGDPVLLDKFMKRLGETLDHIEDATFATVAVVEGYAVAGGCEIVLACDIAVASTTAHIGDGHLEYGLAPAAGGSVRLPRHLSKARANYLLLSGDLLTGREAAEWGLVTFAVAPTQLEAAAERVTDRLNSRSGAALATAKHLIANSRRSAQAEALSLERAVFLQHMDSDEVTEGLTAFRDGRKPGFD